MYHDYLVEWRERKPDGTWKCAKDEVPCCENAREAVRRIRVEYGSADGFRIEAVYRAERSCWEYIEPQYYYEDE